MNDHEIQRKKKDFFFKNQKGGIFFANPGYYAHDPADDRIGRVQDVSSDSGLTVDYRTIDNGL